MTGLYSEDHQMPSFTSGQPPQTLLSNLHTNLYTRLRNHNLDLHPRWQKEQIVSNESAACLEQGQATVLTYFRSREHAQMVERLMGKEHREQVSVVDTFRHPVMEIRLTPEHLVVEMVVSPYAWWDQQNFIGKLELPHHRAYFRTLLRQLDDNCLFGFWQGARADDMHLTNWQLLQGRIFDEWMNTFCDGQDWLRVGKWYSLDETTPNGEELVNEVFETIRSLHTVYTFLLWTSNNNFRSFYEKRQKQIQKAYA